MSHAFAGFLIKDVALIGALGLAEPATIRRFEEPFHGSGLRLPNRLDEVMDLESLLSLAALVPMPRGAEWLFLQYRCWGGIADRVWGYVHGPDQSYGPVGDRSRTATESLCELLMAFGIDHADGPGILPFSRGFWGEPVLI